MQRRIFFKMTLAGIAANVFDPAFAAKSDSNYPAHAARLVITYPPGGSSDLMCRILANKMSQQWGQQIIVENRPGASGSLGTEYAAQQAPDGYTFLFGNVGPMVINPLLSKVSYDADKDFVPISMVATGPNVLVVNSKRKEKTLQDILALARAKPNTLSFGSGGYGTIAHLFGEMLSRSAKIQAIHVPYRGGILAINDLLGQQIDMSVSDILPVLQHIQAGRLRALAITSAARVPQLPDVPTFVESGFPDLVVLNSWGMYLPTGTHPARIARLRTAIDKAITDPDLVKQFYDLGVVAAISSPDELHKFNVAERDKYSQLIKERGIRAE